MQSKNVKLSPGSMTLVSPSKSRVLSKLTATRNIIKNKFRQAYMDRMERERNISDTLKPITSEIAKLKSTKEVKNVRREMQYTSPENRMPLALSNSSSSNDYEDTSSSHDTENDSRPSTSRRVTTPVQRQNLPSSERRRRLNETRRTLNFSESPRTPERTVEILQDAGRRIDRILESTSPGVSDRTRAGVRSRLPVSTRTRHQTTAAARGVSKRGRGLKTYNDSIDFNFIPYNANSHIIYEYFDDPNELCERLRLLVSSRMAGNTNHMQEINSIIEELRELGCID